MKAAYTAAWLGRVNKFPKDPSVLMLAEKRKPKVQSWQHMYALAESWAGSTGAAG